MGTVQLNRIHTKDTKSVLPQIRLYMKRNYYVTYKNGNTKRRSGELVIGHLYAKKKKTDTESDEIFCYLVSK